MEEEARLQARELLLRSRIYRFVALVFAAIGLIVFMLLYFKYIEGDIFEALKRPSLILIVIIPFLPAFILSRMALKTESRFVKILETLEVPEKEEEKAK